MPEIDFSQLDKEQLFSTFQTSEQGLSREEVQKRRSQYGENKLTVRKKIAPWQIYLSQFKNILTLILIGAALLIFFIYFFGEKDQSDLIEAGLILGIVFMITLLGFFQEFKAEKAIESLKRLLAFKAKVIRNGERQEIDVSELVPGDVVFLEEGEKIPADIRLIEVVSLHVNEASLTGESVPVTKTVATLSGKKQIADQTNMVFSGTTIVSGRGRGVVVATGDTTELGKIAHHVAETEEEATPIQKRLDHIGKVLGTVILGICAVVFIFIVFFAKDFNSLPLLQRVIQSFIAAVALAVAAIPEGLPAVVTISLALGTQRMLKKKALVRKLNSVETLGSTDVICSDKTGTLTKGEMTVQKLYVAGKIYDVSGVGYETKGKFSLSGKDVSAEPLVALLATGAFCNNATLGQKGRIIGEPTEAALLVSAAKAEISVPYEKRVLEVPFTSERKMMSVVVKTDGKYVLYSKGAPEILLTKCHVPDADKKQILQVSQEFSTQALRTLGFASRHISQEEFEKHKEDGDALERQLTFVGLQGMIDPAREEVKPLISSCQEAGIRVMMITGDHVETAKAIAHEIGIMGDALTGDELDRLSDKEFVHQVENIHIYARVNPTTKMKIVSALKEKGHIVAMTGDGVNDAPALKKADIGIAMGITGTDVAKEASDMVLLDDKFSTIVSAIEEGRGIFHNIRKFVVYLLSCNIAEVIIIFFGVMVFQELVATATLLLWINVVTDGLPAVALGLDPAEKHILRYSPCAFQTQIVGKRLWFEMVFVGIVLSGLVLWLFASLLPQGLVEAQSAAFSAIVVLELVVLYVIRSNYQVSFFSNIWLFIAVVTSLLLQFLIIYLPWFDNLFHIQFVGVFTWLFIAAGSVFLGLSYKLMRQVVDHVTAKN